MNELNGVNVEGLARMLREYADLDGRADFTFRARTYWLGGGRSQTHVTGFYGAFVEQNSRRFLLEADEPPVLLGRDTAPNPVEHLLHALASCLTSSLAYHAAAHGVAILSCECTLRGELDLRGFLGLAEGVRRGFSKIEVNFRVESDAPPERLAELARFSPVLDVVENGTKVELRIDATPIPEEVVPLVEEEPV